MIEEASFAYVRHVFSQKISVICRLLEFCRVQEWLCFCRQIVVKTPGIFAKTPCISGVNDRGKHPKQEGFLQKDQGKTVKMIGKMKTCPNP